MRHHKVAIYKAEVCFCRRNVFCGCQKVNTHISDLVTVINELLHPDLMAIKSGATKQYINVGVNGLFTALALALQSP